MTLEQMANGGYYCLYKGASSVFVCFQAMLVCE